MSHNLNLNKPIINIMTRYPVIKSVLDVGAGYGAWGQVIRAGLNKKVNLLAIEKYPESCRRLANTGMYSQVICDDAINSLNHFDKGEFDIVLASNVIEHFKKDDGFLLIKIMKALASKLVIIATPRGYMDVSAENNPNIYDRHLSGWTEAELQGVGFETFLIDTRVMTRSIKLIDHIRRLIFRLYDPYQIIAYWDAV